MPEPDAAQLVQSVIDAGREWELDITERGGSLWLDRRGGEPVEPPVEFRFTDDELTAYYRQVAKGAGHEDASPWDWWKTLVSTHLVEAIHELDRLDGQKLINIGDYGFAAAHRP